MKNYKQKRSKPIKRMKKISKEEEEYVNEMEKIKKKINENGDNDMKKDRNKY